jgi:hypothetical protein
MKHQPSAEIDIQCTCASKISEREMIREKKSIKDPAGGESDERVENCREEQRPRRYG